MSPPSGAAYGATVTVHDPEWLVTAGVRMRTFGRGGPARYGLLRRAIWCRRSMEQTSVHVEDRVGRWGRKEVDAVVTVMRWLVAATVVFQVSATIGAGLNPTETFTAVPNPPRAASGR